MSIPCLEVFWINDYELITPACFAVKYNNFHCNSGNISSSKVTDVKYIQIDWYWLLQLADSTAFCPTSQ